MVSADVGLVSMVRQGILALQLLPPNSSSGMFSLMTHITLTQKLFKKQKKNPSLTIKKMVDNAVFMANITKYL